MSGAGAAIGGIASLLGSVGSTIGNVIGNKKAQERADAVNYFMWKKQNEYNHPLQQMSRFKEAGLNPRLIYGNGSASAGNASGAPQSKAAKFNIENPLADVRAFSDIKNKQAQTNNLDAQNEVIVQDALLRQEQVWNETIKGQKMGYEVDKTKYERDRTKFDLDLENELRHYSAEIRKANLANLEQTVIGKQIDNYIKDATQADAIKQVYYHTQMAKMTMKGQQLENQLKKYEAELNAMGLTKSDPLFVRIFPNRRKQYAATSALGQGAKSGAQTYASSKFKTK